MRIPEPMPRGLTFLSAIFLAMVAASRVNNRAGGKVDTVLTLCDHFFCVLMLFFQTCPGAGTEVQRSCRPECSRPPRTAGDKKGFRLGCKAVAIGPARGG